MRPPGVEFGDMRWITFDCFGTLVDWHSGFAAILQPFAGEKTAAVLQAYHRFERLLETETPHRLYEDILATALLRAAGEVGVPLSHVQARTLPQRWDSLRVFEDVEPMLAGLRAAGYRLGVLTNCDDGLFDRTHRSFRTPFDLVVTAERVRDYKPAPAHFRYFARSTGVRPEDWIHVACSWYHDIATVQDLGIARIWLDRDDTGEDPATASARVRSASEVCDAVAGLQRGA